MNRERTGTGFSQPGVHYCCAPIDRLDPEGYFEKGLEIDKGGRQQLRDRFLTVAQK